MEFNVTQQAILWSAFAFFGGYIGTLITLIIAFVGAVISDTFFKSDGEGFLLAFLIFGVGLLTPIARICAAVWAAMLIFGV